MSVDIAEQMASMQVVLRPVADLIPYARNARTHAPSQVAMIAGSIKEFGFTNPVLVDGANGIIAGHGRVMAAQKLGLKQVPTLDLSHLSDTQRRAYILADNQIATKSGWDLDMLGIELSELKEDGFDLGLAGFEPEDLETMLGVLPDGEGLTDPDDAPAAPVHPVTVLGDVWIMGNHRIINGDCTDPLVVDKVLNGVKPNLMVTDPPYGVKYDPSWRVKAGVGGEGTAKGVVLNDHKADWREAWDLFPGAIAYIWHAGTFAGAVAASLDAVKFSIRAQIIWVKTRHVLSRGHYHHQHEPAFYAVREGAEEVWPEPATQSFTPDHEVAVYAVKDGKTGDWHGGRKQSTTWFIEHLKSDTGHGTQKPIACMQRPIENNSSPGQAIYEPFSGSGTTIMAGQITGRSVHACELNPAYVDVAVRRWQNFTGQVATLEGDGRTFDEIAAARPIPSDSVAAD